MSYNKNYNKSSLFYGIINKNTLTIYSNPYSTERTKEFINK